MNNWSVTGGKRLVMGTSGGSRKPGTLARAADEMRAELAEREAGQTKRSLLGGLLVTLRRRGAQWTLAVEREGAAPAASDVEMVARAFGADACGADGAGVVWGARREIHPKSGRLVHYQSATVGWRE
jgi:hypothetical protein